MIIPTTPIEAWCELVESRGDENTIQVLDDSNHLGNIAVRVNDLDGNGGPPSVSFQLSTEDAERLMFLLRCALMNRGGTA
jgi:hypothetical protein